MMGLQLNIAGCDADGDARVLHCRKIDRMQIDVFIRRLLLDLHGDEFQLVLDRVEQRMDPGEMLLREDPVQHRDGRMGGLVEPGSVVRQKDALTVNFKITDGAQSIPVVYTGILPDLFKEGKGVVAQGRLGPDGTFTAHEVLAKHDENYMPPEVKDSLKPHSDAAQAMNSDGT
jgi:cytochrome c-type biogenesis protein CcmE